MKRLGAVRLGKNGEQEAYALEHSELVLGFKGGNLTESWLQFFAANCTERSKLCPSAIG